MSRLRAAFMGSPDFAVPSLHATAQVCELLAVVTQPDRPAGRGRKLSPPAVKAAATNLPGPPVQLLQPTKVRDGTLAAALRALDLDVIVVVAYGRILPVEILELPRYGCINVHGSLLPRWRGAAPIQRAVLAGDAETGVSIMRMDEGCDTGPVYEQHATPIGPEETTGELFERLSALGGQALQAFLPRLPELPPPEPQPEAGAVHAPKLDKAEGRVDWSRPAQALVDHVRGMDPWPGAFTELEGQPLKLFGARLGAGLGAPGLPPGTTPGELLAHDAEGLHIATGAGAVVVAEVQPAGKRRMPAAAFAAGRQLETGTILGRARDA